MMRQIEKILEAISVAAAWTGAAAVLTMAILGGLDVFSTVFAGRPLAATVETTEALMVFSAFLGLGLLHKRRAYIAVDLLRERSDLPVRRALDILSLLLMASYFGLIAWRGWINAFDSLSFREYSNGLIRVPLYPSKFALAFGMTIGTLWCTLELVKGGLFREVAPNAPHDVLPET